jgi:hypothetical protein
MTVTIIESPAYDGVGIPTAAPLPEWELVRFRGQLVPLSKNQAMKMLLDKPKEETRGRNPLLVLFATPQSF